MSPTPPSKPNLPGCIYCNPQGYPEMIKSFVPCPHCDNPPRTEAVGDDRINIPEDPTPTIQLLESEVARLEERLKAVTNGYESAKTIVAESVKAERERCERGR